MISRKYIYAIALSLSAMLDVCAEPFTDFFIRFFYDSDHQAAKINYPITTPSGITRAKSGWQVQTVKDKSKMIVVYSDSTDAILTYKSISPAVLDMRGLNGATYTFTPYASQSWKLKNISSFPNTSFADKDFMSFLERFCGDKEFQKKHIIFPLKEVTYTEKNGKEEAESSRLFMPQNWQYVDFYSQFQQFCWFRTGEDASANRQIMIYEKETKTMLYNFIKIRSNWFLIELSRYK